MFCNFIKEIQFMNNEILFNKEFILNNNRTVIGLKTTHITQIFK